MVVPKIMGSETEFGVKVDEKICFRPAYFIINTLFTQNDVVLGDFCRPDWVGIEKDILMAREGGISQDSEFNWKLYGLYGFNGGRIYPENIWLPESSTPECSDARELVNYEKAGEWILEGAKQLSQNIIGSRINLYKNNYGFSGNMKGSQRQESYGCHMNFLVGRRFFSLLTMESKFAEANIMQDLLISYKLAMIICTGSGRVGFMSGREVCDYQISQRADFMRRLFAYDTTSNRPIINTRDNPYADSEKYGRLHDIFFDSNMSETSIFLKAGITALVLEALEDSYNLYRIPIPIKNPIKTLYKISRDLSLEEELIEFENGRRMRALDLLKNHWLPLLKDYVVYRKKNDPVTTELIERWEDVLKKLDRNPDLTFGILDWTTKKRLIKEYLYKNGGKAKALSLRRALLEMVRQGCLSSFTNREELLRQFSDPEKIVKLLNFWETEFKDWLKCVDIQYHDTNRKTGLYYILEKSGKMERITSNNEIENAIFSPPKGTRAYFRQKFIKKFGADSVGWNIIKLREKSSGRSLSLENLDPVFLNEENSDLLVDGCDNIEEFLNIIRASGGDEKGMVLSEFNPLKFRLRAINEEED